MEFNVENVLEIICGPRSQMITSSKRLGPPMAVYNSSIKIFDRKIWWGDVDVDLVRKPLLRLAAMLTSPHNELAKIEIYSEGGMLVWSSLNPDVAWDKPYYEAKKFLTAFSKKQIRQWKVDHGILKKNKKAKV